MWRIRMSEQACKLSAVPTTLRKTPTAVDLFCGAGGLSLGFWQAGGRPVAAIDSDADSVDTYRQMFPVCDQVIHGDVQDWMPRLPRQVDVLMGGPPCQGFSPARGLRFLDDPRNHLYRHFIRLIARLEPRWVVMENVPGVTSLGGGSFLEQILRDFGRIGYSLDWRVVNMADYGVPQVRKRTIFIGNRDGLSFTWPRQTHRARAGNSADAMGLRSLPTQVSIQEALGDLPWPMGDFFSHRANSQMRGPRNRLTRTDPAFTLRVRPDEFGLCETPAEGAFIPGPLPEIAFAYRAPHSSFQELMREDPPKWIIPTLVPVTDSASVRLTGSRRLATRELARLQSFPDWFTFSGSAYSQGRQIGNAVPPLFARQLFCSIFGSRHSTGVTDDSARARDDQHESRNRRKSDNEKKTRQPAVTRRVTAKAGGT